MPTATALLATVDPAALPAATAQIIAAVQERTDRIRSGAVSGVPALLEFDEAGADLDNLANVCRLLAQTHPAAEVRSAADRASQELQRYATDLSLDRTLADATAEVDAAGEDAATRHYLDRIRRDFRRAGVDRDDAVRDRIRQLRDELVEIGQSFANNLNADTRSIRLPVADLAGLPEDWIAGHPVAADGTVTVTTDYPDLLPFLAYASDAGARERLWREFRRRGHPANIDVMDRLLARRHELATLLGYESWAEYVTEDKMIGSSSAAEAFITEIADAAQARMQREYAALLARKQVDDPTATVVEPWDSSYLQERVKAERFAYDSQALRPYFEFTRVLDGLMTIAEALFGVRFEPRPELATWHAEVTGYDVVNAAGEPLGRIYLDLHPRPHKFGHAAMFPLIHGVIGRPEGTLDRRLPECALVCNFPRPGELLQHREVETFFHEFGHLLHHILGGAQRWAGISGIRTEWDFVEAPSQLLEEWTRDAATLATFAVHHETGEPLPAERVAQLRAAGDFGTGLQIRQQLSYAALSLELYRRDPATVSPTAVEAETTTRFSPYRYVDETFQHLSFGHLVDYSAAYYTYVWSLAIAKDLFTGFDPEALLAPEAASRYRAAVLGGGGSAPAAELVRAFLGRDHTFDAFRAWLDSSE